MCSTVIWEEIRQSVMDLERLLQVETVDDTGERSREIETPEMIEPH